MTHDYELGELHSVVDWDLPDVVARLRQVRLSWRKKHMKSTRIGPRRFPSRSALEIILTGLKSALYPLRLAAYQVSDSNEDYYVGQALTEALGGLQEQIRLELEYEGRSQASVGPKVGPDEIVRAFAESLPALRELLDSDVEAAFSGDPAARSVDEVLICYPGILVVIHHRIAHRLHGLGARLVARIIAEISHSETGIDIHPGATIGRSFFIDHGTGAVIGETAVIGDRVRLYQAVTLGARSLPSDQNGIVKSSAPRHPVIQDDVVIYAGATILGRITVGRGSTIGGNVWLTADVPPASRITQANARQLRSSADQGCEVRLTGIDD